MDIQPDRDALLIIDLQPDFMPGGALAVGEGDRIVAPIARLLPRFRTIVATQDWHPAGHRSFATSNAAEVFSQGKLHGAAQTMWPDHCVQGSPGAELHADLPTAPLSLILRKGTTPDVDSYSAFRENLGPDGARAPTGLAGWLRERGIRRVFLCGLARDFCVRWSAEDARAAGFAAVLLDDLTRSVVPANDPATRQAIVAAGVEITTSDQLA